jgi:hypothetical protein
VLCQVPARQSLQQRAASPGLLYVQWVVLSCGARQAIHWASIKQHVVAWKWLWGTGMQGSAAHIWHLTAHLLSHGRAAWVSPWYTRCRSVSTVYAAGCCWGAAGERSNGGATI